MHGKRENDNASARERVIKEIGSLLYKRKKTGPCTTVSQRGGCPSLRERKGRKLMKGCLLPRELWNPAYGGNGR